MKGNQRLLRGTLRGGVGWLAKNLWTFSTPWKHWKTLWVKDCFFSQKFCLPFQQTNPNIFPPKRKVEKNIDSKVTWKSSMLLLKRVFIVKNWTETQKDRFVSSSSPMDGLSGANLLGNSSRWSPPKHGSESHEVNSQLPRGKYSSTKGTFIKLEKKRYILQNEIVQKRLSLHFFPPNPNCSGYSWEWISYIWHSKKSWPKTPR